MASKMIETNQAPAAIGPYSQGIAVGSWLFVSGQLGLNPETGEMVGTEFGAQVRQALENMRQIVLAGGCDLSHVVAN